MGYFFVHGTYPDMTSAMIGNAVHLPTSPGYTGTHPVLHADDSEPAAGAADPRHPLRRSPARRHLIQPELRVLVDLGYSDYGAGHSYAERAHPGRTVHDAQPVRRRPRPDQGHLCKAPYAAAVEIGVEAGFWGPDVLPDHLPVGPVHGPGT